MDEENEKQLNFIRSELNPRANFEGKRTGPPPYLECIHAFRGPGGNVVFVVPVGTEGYRFEGDDPGPDNTDSRPIRITCPNVAASITAPNEAIVGSLSIAGRISDVALVKNASVIGVLGTLTLSMNAEALRFGEEFTRPITQLSCVPTIGGTQPRTWDYSIQIHFDGEHLNVTVGIISAALRNGNLTTPIGILSEGEELLMRAPVTPIKVIVSRDIRSANAELPCSFRLRNIVK